MKSCIDNSFPADSAFRERLLRLDSLYAELDARLAAFAAAGPYRCPPGCGRCSAKFEPDILPVEAVYAALAARAAGIDAEALRSRPAGRCPLYREDDDRHCPIYPARPLVCRLFGFSALPDKTGALVYTPCEHMESVCGAERRSWKVSALPVPGPSLPPDMTEYSTRLSLLAPGEEGARRPMRLALCDAARRVGLYGMMMRGDGGRPNNDRRKNASQLGYN